MKWITVIHIATEQRDDVTGPGGRCAANTAEPCQKCLKSQSMNEDMYYYYPGFLSYPGVFTVENHYI